MKPSVIFCDFDGTICIPDSSEYLLEKFGSPIWLELDEQVWQGKITEREAFPRQLLTMRADWATAREELLRGVRIREGFSDFVKWSHSRNIPFVILSSGLRILLDELLDAAGVGNLPIYSQEARITDGRWELISYSGERFEDHCSLCKCVFLERERALGKQIIYIGDGYTDLCPSKRADVLFATGNLARSWQQNGNNSFYTFESFHDIERKLDALMLQDQESQI